MSVRGIVDSVGMIVAFVLCTYQSFVIYNADWMKTGCTRLEFSEVFYRITEDDYRINKETHEYVFNVTYFFEANGKERSFRRQQAYQSESSAELGMRVRKRSLDRIEIWYSRSNPETYQLESKPSWLIYLSFDLIPLAYWIFSVRAALESYKLKKRKNGSKPA